MHAYRQHTAAQRDVISAAFVRNGACTTLQQQQKRDISASLSINTVSNNSTYDEQSITDLASARARYPHESMFSLHEDLLQMHT